MNILIAYDGSDCAKAAMDDLQLAGLPTAAQALVLAVAEGWPILTSGTFGTLGEQGVLQSPQAVQSAAVLADDAMDEAGELAKEGADRLKDLFPGWEIEARASGGGAAHTIIEAAEALPADMVVVGSHGRSAVERLFFGSVSQKVARYAPCAVRVARGSSDRGVGPPRLVIGFDGSSESHAAVSAVAQRRWSRGTQAWLLTALDIRLSATFPTFGDDDAIKPLEGQARSAAAMLRDAGLEAACELRPGYPNRLLIQEAQARDADCLFVGARGATRLERFLMGTVSSAVIGRAHCTVEVIRERATKDPAKPG